MQKTDRNPSNGQHSKTKTAIGKINYASALNLCNKAVAFPYLFPGFVSEILKTSPSGRS